MSFTKKILINGRFVETGDELKVVNPYDQSVAGKTFLAGPVEVEEAIASSAKAFGKLKTLPSYKRGEMLAKVASIIEARAEEFAKTIAAESGKPIKDARAEVKRGVNTFVIASEEAKRLNGEVLPLDISPGSEGRSAIVKRFPIGPVLGITPFNFPLNLVAHKIAPAMACANPIILKPALNTPLTALMLGEAITEAGWPDGGVNVIPCSNENAEAMALDDRIKKLSFTGSAAVGWMLKSKAGTKKVTLELGGNAGVIIDRDADIETTAKRCALGAFAYAGQICISVQRIYAHRGIFSEFVGSFVEASGRIKMGNPMDETTELGPMIDEKAAMRTEGWVKEALSSGAKLLHGGKRRGAFFEPTILTDTTPDMKVCGSELFAPVAVVEPFDRFEDAVSMVNGGLYGLQAGVFTNSMDKAFYAYRELEAGGVIINDIPTYRVDSMPYGGIKMSGFGRESVKYAIEEMTELKTLVIKGI